MLNRNTTATPATGTEVTPPGSTTAGGEEGKGSQQVPLWKLKQATDKLKDQEALLKKYQDAERQKQEDEAKAKGDFEKILSTERQEKEKLAREKDELVQQRKQDKLESAVLKEVSKHSPNDSDDVLKFIDLAKLTVDESGHVSGVKEAVEKLKSEKPYLFGSTTKVNPDENGKSAAGSDALKALETEYHALLSKSQTPGSGVTPDESRRLGFLARQLSKLKQEQKK